MLRVSIITNIPAPYSVDLYKEINKYAVDFELSIIFSRMQRNNREWSIDISGLDNVYSLDSIVIPRKIENDIRYIHIPKGTWKTLNSVNPDILFVYEYSLTSLLSLFWAKLKKRKFVHVTEGTIHSEKRISILQKLIRRLIISNSDSYIACSTKSVEKLIAWNAKKSKIKKVLLTADISKFVIDKKEEVQRKEKCPNLLYVGSIVDRKGIDLLIQSLVYVDVEFHLKLIGSGDPLYIEEIKCLAREKGLYEKLEFIPFIEGEQLIDQYKQADIFVFPSRQDCYGLVLVEAFCSCLPICSSQYADGAYDVIDDGYNGFIVDPYNYKAFGSAIKRLITDKKFSENALKNDVSKFEIKKEAMGFVDEIKNLRSI